MACFLVPSAAARSTSSPRSLRSGATGATASASSCRSARSALDASSRPTLPASGRSQSFTPRLAELLVGENPRWEDQEPDVLASERRVRDDGAVVPSSRRRNPVNRASSRNASAIVRSAVSPCMRPSTTRSCLGARRTSMSVMLQCRTISRMWRSANAAEGASMTCSNTQPSVSAIVAMYVYLPACRIATLVIDRPRGTTSGGTKRSLKGVKQRSIGR
jgi:hypothetical protein